MMKPELSKKNPYFLPKHRRYELMHFCFQYHEWERDMEYCNVLESNSTIVVAKLRNGATYNRTEAIAILRAESGKKIKMIEEALRNTTNDISIQKCLKDGLIEAESYDSVEYF